VRAYLVSRLGQTAQVVFLALTAVFFLIRLGGDPVLLFLPMDIQAKDVNELRQRLGFNDPLLVQYGRSLTGAIHGDFGESLRYGRPIARNGSSSALGGAAGAALGAAVEVAGPRR
jgi:ABC-type dipeptide/oligopeptide/nickel transport system permease component